VKVIFTIDSNLHCTGNGGENISAPISPKPAVKIAMVKIVSVVVYILINGAM
jgi:hypothetical protein